MLVYYHDCIINYIYDCNQVEDSKSITTEIQGMYTYVIANL